VSGCFARARQRPLETAAVRPPAIKPQGACLVGGRRLRRLAPGMEARQGGDALAAPCPCTTARPGGDAKKVVALRFVFQVESLRCLVTAFNEMSCDASIVKTTDATEDKSPKRGSVTGYTPHQSTYLAYRITLEGRGEDAFAKSLSSARVETKPHQVDASLFALHSLLSRGVILADEVGLGKAIEASLVIAQRWAERRRRILLIVPASLRKQWQQELREKFSLPSTILETKTFRDAEKAGRIRPFDVTDAIIITSYEFAARRADDVRLSPWDLVIFDEAHRLRNVY
jgi:hypothetical protein